MSHRFLEYYCIRALYFSPLYVLGFRVMLVSSTAKLNTIWYCLPFKVISKLRAVDLSHEVQIDHIFIILTTLSRRIV